MMRTGHITLLCLLLPLCTLVASTPIKGNQVGTGKPGKCPPERYYNKIEHEICHKHCAMDSNCPGTMKCCFDNCHMMCKPPAQEKADLCPTFVSALSNAAKCNDNCTSDCECPGTAKCCFKTCGKTCVPTLSDLAKPSMVSTTRRGFCPQEEIYNCTRKERISCDNSSCVDGYKCCPKICRGECQKALEERAGNCPAANTICPLGTTNTTCTSDYDCTTFFKCCSTNCGKRCIKALNVPSSLKEH